MNKKEISRKMFEIKSELETKVLTDEEKIKLSDEYKKLKSELAKIMINEITVEREEEKKK